MRVCSVGAVLVCVSACGPEEPAKSPHQGQSFAEAMELLCNVDARLGVSAEDNPISIDMERHDWFMTHVKNPDGIELVTLLRVKTDSQRVTMLRNAAHRAALTRCALASALQRSAAS